MQLTFKCFRKHTLTYTKVLTLVSSLYYSCYFLVSLKLFQKKEGFFLSLYKDIDSKYYFPTSHILLLYFTVLSSVDHSFTSSGWPCKHLSLQPPHPTPPLRTVRSKYYSIYSISTLSRGARGLELEFLSNAMVFSPDLQKLWPGEGGACL